MRIINPILLLSFSCALLGSLPTIANDVTNAPTKKYVAPAAIDWQPCPTETNANLLCAKYPVPLDYSTRRKNPAIIEIALVKSPAQDTSQKPLGSLFLNPGGPGASGVQLVQNFGAFMFGQAVRDRYDLIGFDPRGINLSNPLTCGLTFEQLGQVTPPFVFPSTRREERQKFKSDRLASALCAVQGNDILHYMSTANVARDLDLLRQAVGDEELNFVGYSYGSYLGVTYANLFPNRVGRLVIDGVLDPVAWSTAWNWSSWFVPVSTRLESDKHSMATLQEFFRLCDAAGPGSCSIAPDSAARFDQVAQQLKRQPLPVQFADGSLGELGFSQFIGVATQGLNNSAHWSHFADFVAFVEAQFPPEIVGQQYSLLQTELGLEDDQQLPIDNGRFAFEGVLCSDSDNPIQPEFWSLWAAESEWQNGYFGRLWTWNSSLCAQWPSMKKGRYMGPFNKYTKNPVLIASTLFDPATPYTGAQVVASLLPNSRLLTVAGWGHTTTGISACADHFTDDYLLTGALPPQGTVCEQSVAPFNTGEPPTLFSHKAPSDQDDAAAAAKTQAEIDKTQEEINKARVRDAIIRANSPARR